MVQSSRRT